MAQTYPMHGFVLVVAFATFFALRRAAELEAEISVVKNTDEATALRRLGTMLRALRHDYKVARNVADGAAEAAAKCQVTAVDPSRG